MSEVISEREFHGVICTEEGKKVLIYWLCQDWEEQVKVEVPFDAPLCIVHCCEFDVKIKDLRA
jgi:hypothetical protein